MLISEMIKKLEKVQEEHGDLSVFSQQIGWEESDSYEIDPELSVVEGIQMIVDKPGYREGFKRLLII